MKKLLSIFLAILMTVSCFAFSASAFKRTYTAKDCLNNYLCVKEVEKSSGGSTYTTYNTYDSNGRLVKSVFKSDDGETLTYTCTYDSKGNPTKEKSKRSDGYTESASYSYHSDGNVKKYTFKNSYGYSETKSYKYDSKGKVTEEKSASSYSTVTKFSYNSKGNISKKTTVYSNGNKDVFTYSYDSKGRIIKAAEKSSDGTATSNTYTYDSKGNLKKEVYTTFDGTKISTVYTYDSKGNPTKITENGKLRASCTYDSKGRVKKSKEAGFDDVIYTYVNTYDSNGNLSKKVTSDTSGSKTTNTYKYNKISSPICITDDGIRLSKYKYTYDGKAKKPAVEINGYLKGSGYSVSYSNNVNPGKAKITITFTDPRTQPITIYFEILPAKVTGLKASEITESSVSLKWSKSAKAEKYIVYMYDSTSGKYAAVKTVTTNKATIKDLKSGTSYKFCVRAVAGGVKGAYSAKVTAKTK